MTPEQSLDNLEIPEREVKDERVSYLTADFKRDIPIGPYAYELFHVTGLGGALSYNGLINFELQQIYIDADINETKQNVTLIHELVHAALYLHTVDHEDGVVRVGEEALCNMVGQVLTQAGFRAEEIF